MADHPILSFYSPELVLCFDLGKYKSLRWRPMYDKPGEFELHTSPHLFPSNLQSSSFKPELLSHRNQTNEHSLQYEIEIYFS